MKWERELGNETGPKKKEKKEGPAQGRKMRENGEKKGRGNGAGPGKKKRTRPNLRKGKKRKGKEKEGGPDWEE